MKDISQKLEKSKADNLELKTKNKKLTDSSEEIERELRNTQKAKEMYKQEIENLKNSIIEKQEMVVEFQNKYLNLQTEYNRSIKTYKTEIETLNEKLEHSDKLDQIKTEEIEKLQNELDHVFDELIKSKTENKQGFLNKIISFFK